jgi:hypothetical protein
MTATIVSESTSFTSASAMQHTSGNGAHSAGVCMSAAS